MAMRRGQGAFPFLFGGAFIEAAGSSRLVRETSQPSLRFRRDFL